MYLSKRYSSHKNVERTQGHGDVAYIVIYAFKQPSPTDAKMKTMRALNYCRLKDAATNNKMNHKRVSIHGEMVEGVKVR